MKKREINKEDLITIRQAVSYSVIALRNVKKSANDIDELELSKSILSVMQLYEGNDAEVVADDILKKL